jgi:hypothetical protein
MTNYLINAELTHMYSSYLNKDCSGLGNILFQIATVYGLSITTNRNIEYPEVLRFAKKLKEEFNLEHINTIYRKCISSNTSIDNVVKYVNWECSPSVDQVLEFITNNSNNNVSLQGYLAHPPFYIAYTDKIRELFEVDDNSLQFIKNKYPILFDDSYTTISLHFRYDKIDEVTRMYRAHFVNCINYIKDKVQNPIFLLFSDSVEFAKKEFEGIDNIIFIENNPDYIDLWMMAMCKHNICSKSTMSWWGAYLNSNKDKIIIYPNAWHYLFHYIDGSVSI